MHTLTKLQRFLKIICKKLVSKERLNNDHYRNKKCS